MSDALGPHEGEQHEVILLALVLVHRRHGPRRTEHRVRAALGQDVADQMFLGEEQEEEGSGCMLVSGLGVSRRNRREKDWYIIGWLGSG